MDEQRLKELVAEVSFSLFADAGEKIGTDSPGSFALGCSMILETFNAVLELRLDEDVAGDIVQLAGTLFHSGIEALQEKKEWEEVEDFFNSGK